eukprot:411276-Amphidinium_carterae.1
MSFTKEMMLSACALAAPMGGGKAEDAAYAEHVAPRVRAMCFHCYPSYLKAWGSNSSWIHSIMSPGLQVVAPEPDGDSGAEENYESELGENYDKEAEEDYEKELGENYDKEAGENYGKETSGCKRKEWQGHAVCALEQGGGGQGLQEFDAD